MPVGPHTGVAARLAQLPNCDNVCQVLGRRAVERNVPELFQSRGQSQRKLAPTLGTMTAPALVIDRLFITVVLLYCVVPLVEGRGQPFELVRHPLGTTGQDSRPTRRRGRGRVVFFIFFFVSG
jgi:hypothetical protein